jgi:hypothetical protein
MSGLKPGKTATIDQLAARIASNLLDGAQALAAGREHRSRASSWLTESTLLIVELIRTGVENQPEILQHLETTISGSVSLHRAGDLHVRAARLVMGRHVDARRAYRVSAAARQLVAMGANDPRESLIKLGGVSALATAWGKRNATVAWQDISGDATPSSVVVHAPADLIAALVATRGFVYAVIAVGQGGRCNLVTTDTDVDRMARSGH